MSVLSRGSMVYVRHPDKPDKTFPVSSEFCFHTRKATQYQLPDHKESLPPDLPCLHIPTFQIRSEGSVHPDNYDVPQNLLLRSFLYSLPVQKQILYQPDICPEEAVLSEHVPQNVRHPIIPEHFSGNNGSVPIDPLSLSPAPVSL